MKTSNLIVAVALLIVVSCNLGKGPGEPVMVFGIHEVVMPGELPESVTGLLQSKGIAVEMRAQEPFAGYTVSADSLVLPVDFPADGVRLVSMPGLSGGDPQRIVLVTVKSDPLVDNAMVRTTKNKDNSVIIYFNRKGAVRWAEMTRKNVGKTVAFLLDGRVYALPVVNAEIRNGVAMIGGLENNTMAEKISDALNGKK